MAYRDFSLGKVKKEFQISEHKCALFVDPLSLAPQAQAMPLPLHLLITNHVFAHPVSTLESQTYVEQQC